MIDIKLIRENPSLIKKNCKNRGYDINVDEIIQLDVEWKKLKTEDDSLRAERNKVSEEINQAKKAKKPIDSILKRAKAIPLKLVENEKEENELKAKIDFLISSLPNIQAPEVPIGDAEKNKEIHKSGKILKIKNPKGHLELLEAMDLIDMKRATKISGAGFYILKGKAAKLQRALVQFMLDFHVKKGFTEINPPQMVNRKSAFGTGNLPKFEDQLYKTNDDLILVPTAEVPVTNIYSDETLFEKDLPKKFCAFTECYRTEAGRKAGEEGLFRLHQFEGTFEIVNEYGMHDRSIVKFINVANQYEADVAVEKVGEQGRVSGRSILGLITLGLSHGSKMRLYVSGNGDARKCFDDLKCLVASGFGEAYA